MSLTFESYIDVIAGLLTIAPKDMNFLAFVPMMIDYAEQRIYRELDLLSTTVADASSTTTAANRSLSLPSGVNAPHFTVVQGLSVIIPAGAAPANGTRVPLVPVTKEFLDMSWPSASGAAVPAFFAPFTDQSVILGPWPDQSYAVEVVGTVRPVPLSIANPTTFLTTYLPDLFVAASMVIASGRERNFGSQGDDPKMAMSWEQQYQTLWASAHAEDLRRKFSAGAGTSSTQPVVGGSGGATPAGA